MFLGRPAPLCLFVLVAACGQPASAPLAASSFSPPAQLQATPQCAQPVILTATTTKLTPSTAHAGVTEFPLRQAGGPTGIAAAPSGGAWFTEEDQGRIALIASDGTLTEWSLPNGLVKPGAYIDSDSNGGIWFPERGEATISHVDRTGQYRACRLPFPAEPFSVAVDGHRVWFTDFTSSHIGYMDTSDGTIRYWSTSSVLGQPSGIAVTANGVWFSDYSSNALLRVTGTDHLSLAHMPSPGGAMGMARARDGSIWIAQSGSDRVVRLVSSGTLTSYSLGSSAQQPQSTAEAEDGSIWVTESRSNSLGKLRPDGSNAQTLAVGQWPDGIVTSGGRVWFTEYQSEAVGFVAAG